MTINDLTRLSDGLTYSFTIYGISILTNTIIHYVTA